MDKDQFISTNMAKYENNTKYMSTVMDLTNATKQFQRNFNAKINDNENLQLCIKVMMILLLMFIVSALIKAVAATIFRQDGSELLKLLLGVVIAFIIYFFGIKYNIIL